MDFLKEKFFDKDNKIKTLFTKDGCLLHLEENKKIEEKEKKEFTENFIDGLVKNGFINKDVINKVKDKYPDNPWSIDFPSWHGKFGKGKKIFIIGQEPHIHHKYLQTVYGFHNEKTINEHINGTHRIFGIISKLFSDKLNMTEEKVLEDCYLTDLFPLSPYNGKNDESKKNSKRLSFGSAKSLQRLIEDTGNWVDIRCNYAVKKNLEDEIKGVNPEIIVTQGKAVFEEVINEILKVKKEKEIAIEPEKGKRQFIRTAKWENIDIISVPHIGSRRMATFWSNNLDSIKKALEQI